MLKKKLQAFLREWGVPFLIVISVVAPFRSAIADYNYIPSGSMKPTLLVGDNVFVNKLAYDLKVPFTTCHIAQWGNPERGEVVVFYGPKDRIRMVKRVIGLPGDRIEMKDNCLIINGNPVDYAPSEPVAGLTVVEQKLCEFNNEKLGDRFHAIMKIPFTNSLRDFEPVEVPEGKYFMLGDCRDNSKDSRFWGFVDRTDIVGRAEMVLWSKPAWELATPIIERFLRKII